jgi:uncharacterized protein (DUF3084 family)
MAIFSKRIQDAYYLNEDYTIVEIIFEDDNGNLVNHIIEVDPGHEDFKDLEKEGYDAKTLIEKTDEYKKKQSSAFNVAVNREARILAEKMLGLDTLNDRKARLERDIEETQKKILKKDQELNEKEKELTVKLVTKKEQLEKEIEKKEQSLKVQLLNKKEQLEREIEERQKRISRKDEEIEERQKKIMKKDEELKRKEESVLDLGQKERKMKNMAGSVFFDTIFESNTDRDELFKLKLWALEKDFVKKMPAEDKTRIRKAPRMTEVFSILDKYLSE